MLYERILKGSFMKVSFFLLSMVLFPIYCLGDSLTVQKDDLECLSRGHKILLTRGLQIQAQILDPVAEFDVARWRESHFTTLNFHYGSTPSLLEAHPEILWAKWTGYDSSISAEEKPHVANLVSLQYGDEWDLSNSTLVTKAAETLRQWRKEYPNVLSIVNQYGNQCDIGILKSFIEEAEPDMLTMDTYPFFGGLGGIKDGLMGGSPTTLYEHMQVFRKVGLGGYDGTGEKPLPYGLYLQTFNFTDPKINPERRIPSESEMRLNQFSAWAFGYTFTSAFIYSTPDHRFKIAAVLFDGFGDKKPTALFHQIKETNRQSLNLGPALVRLLSRDIRLVPGLHVDPKSKAKVENRLPSDIMRWSMKSDPYMTSITAENLGKKNDGLRGDVLVGYFRPLLKSDYDGDKNNRYFMIVNGLTGITDSAAETRQKITITFDFGTSGIKGLQRLNRDTGKVEKVPCICDGGSRYHVVLVLDGGTGDLFKYGNGKQFVGKP
jgi:hypothetical protein